MGITRDRAGALEQPNNPSTQNNLIETSDPEHSCVKMANAADTGSSEHSHCSTGRGRGSGQPWQPFVEP